MFLWWCLLARSAGVSPRRLLALGSPPCVTSHLHVSLCPRAAAQCSGVDPRRSRAPTSAATAAPPSAPGLASADPDAPWSALAAAAPSPSAAGGGSGSLDLTVLRRVSTRALDLGSRVPKSFSVFFAEDSRERYTSLMVCSAPSRTALSLDASAFSTGSQSFFLTTPLPWREMTRASSVRHAACDLLFLVLSALTKKGAYLLGRITVEATSMISRKASTTRSFPPPPLFSQR
mmetsp:Transcript_12561/g.29558  ORF Transcript_12561/g.29558 Transcript_12561/m.29558 type:complete len:232 (+) Transcript_12561:103-798(+)